MPADCVGTLPRWALVPNEYGCALDAVMPLLASQGAPRVQCAVPALAAEVFQRIPQRAGDAPARAALWVEPLADSWQPELETLAAGLEWGSILCVIASRPLARLVPERQGWPGEPLGLQRGGLRRLRRALRDRGFTIDDEYGFHTVQAVVHSTLGALASRLGRPDLGDRLGFAGQLRYVTSGPLASLSTVALLVTRNVRHGGSAGSGQVGS